MQYNQTCGITHSLLSDDIEKEIKLVYLAIPDREHYDSVIEIQVVPSGNNTPNDSEVVPSGNNTPNDSEVVPSGNNTPNDSEVVPSGNNTPNDSEVVPSGNNTPNDSEVVPSGNNTPNDSEVVPSGNNTPNDSEVVPSGNNTPNGSEVVPSGNNTPNGSEENVRESIVTPEKQTSRKQRYITIIPRKQAKYVSLPKRIVTRKRKDNPDKWQKKETETSWKWVHWYQGKDCWSQRNERHWL